MPARSHLSRKFRSDCCRGAQMPGAELFDGRHATSSRYCPMYVMSTDNVIKLVSLPTHEEAKAKGLLVEYDAATHGPCAFVSQTWLRNSHPDDEKGSKCKLLKSVLSKACRGELSITPNVNAKIIYGSTIKLEIPAKQTKRIRDGFVWFDIYSVPQEDKELQAKSIASIHSYVGDSEFFFVLAGAWSHDNGQVRDFRAWESRGWCRVEQISNALSLRSKPLIVIQSSSDIRTYGPGGHPGREWINRPVGVGQFTVDADRAKLGSVIQGMIEAKMAAGLAAGDEEGMLWYRLLLVMKPKLLQGLGSKGEDARAAQPRGLDDWLDLLKFNKLDEKKPIFGSPLRLAAMSQRSDLVKELCKRGANVNAFTKKSYPQFMGTPKLNVIGSAAFCAETETVQALLDAGADPTMHDGGAGSTAMAYACASGNIGAVDAMLAHNPDYSSFGNNFGMAAFVFAAEFSQAELLKHLISKYPQHLNIDGAMGDATGMHCSFAGFLAGGIGDLDSFKVLCDSGSDPMVYQPEKMGPVFRKIVTVSATLFKVMKRPPLIVEQMALVSGTGFHGAAFQGNLQLIQEMITRSCDVASSAHRFGMTPLHIAAYSGHQEVAAQLVAAGAPLHIKDKRGRTPASWAKYRGHTELASSLTRPSKGEQSVRV